MTQPECLTDPQPTKAEQREQQAIAHPRLRGKDLRQLQRIKRLRRARPGTARRPGLPRCFVDAIPCRNGL